MMHLTRVDLPAPFSPSSAWNAPASTLIDTSSSATSGPKRLVIPMVSSAGARTAAATGGVISFGRVAKTLAVAARRLGEAAGCPVGVDDLAFPRQTITT